MFPAKIVVAFTACCIGAALNAEESFIGPVLPSATTTPTAPAAAPNTAAAAATAVKPAEPKAPSMLESFKKTTFSRTPVSSLREWAGLPPEVASAAPAQLNAAAMAAAALAGSGIPTTSPATSSTATTTTTQPAADPYAPKLAALRKDVATGNWKAVGAFLSEHFKDTPADAKQAYQHLVDALGRATIQQPQQQQQQIPRYFLETNVLSPRDIVELGDQCPHELDEEIVKKFGGLLSTSVQNGHMLEEAQKLMDAGTAKLGGKDLKTRRNAARLLIAAGKPIEAAAFLPKQETAAAEKDIASLNLLATSAEGRFARDGKPEDLEYAWRVTQGALSLADVDKTERSLALRRAVELATKVRSEFGLKWLTDSFTSKPELGMEILSGIGAASVQSRREPKHDNRLLNLELQSRAVEALIKASPQRAKEWGQALTLLAMNWLAEAKFSQERDTSTTRGPQMNYDAFGNLYFGDFQQMQMQGQQNQFQAIPTGKILAIAPGDTWVEAIESSLRPTLLTQIATLHLKVKDEAAAFPFIEKLAKLSPSEARALVDRFIEVWGENHDPNADRRRTNRYMFIYGYNPQADGIPLTRSRQERNLDELSTWVKKLRALNLGEMDEAKIAAAFMKTHSSAEVFRLENIEKVFGGLDQMKAQTLAAILGTMRQNLATVWRSPKEQQAKKTKRTDKEIIAEVQRGYKVTAAVVAKGEKRFPQDWKLRLAKASLMLDETNFRNLEDKESSFSKEREAAFAVFREAADLYAKALPTMELKDQSADVFLAWFYASLGAPDLEGVKPEQTPSPKQGALIRAALTSLPGEAAERHETLFANALSTRMTAAAPAVKHRYLSQGLPIAGTNERAREARALFDYYADLVTEIKLDARIDGPAVVGTAPFGVFVNIRHTKQIEREAGGFQKYLQNQNSQQGFYNFGRPLENYRDKFEDAAREALSESYEVLSVTFHTDKIEARGDAEPGWRVTPYCYLLLKAKGPQTDSLPAFKLNLDFMDTSGYAILPIESSRLLLDASQPAPPRPVRKLEIQQILDERKAKEGILGLEIKATAHGLVPPLDALMDLNPADFEIASMEDQGVRVVQMDTGDESDDGSADAVSERIWNVTLHAKKDLAAPPKHFAFAKPKTEEIKPVYYRYADADLQPVAANVELGATYGEPRMSWQWLWLGAVIPVGVVMLRKGRKRGPDGPVAPFAVPDEITPLSVLGLLERIKSHGKLDAATKTELDQTLASMKRQLYAPQADSSAPDLAGTAREWVARAVKFA